jgi:hypothetical protein
MLADGWASARGITPAAVVAVTTAGRRTSLVGACAKAANAHTMAAAASSLDRPNNHRAPTGKDATYPLEPPHRLAVQNVGRALGAFAPIAAFIKTVAHCAHHRWSRTIRGFTADRNHRLPSRLLAALPIHLI